MFFSQEDNFLIKRFSKEGKYLKLLLINFYATKKHRINIFIVK